MSELMRNLTILLPTRNEVEGLGMVIDQIPSEKLHELGWNSHLIIVDGY